MMTTLSAPPPIVLPDLDDEAVDDDEQLGRLENLKQLEPDATAQQDIRDYLIDSLVSEPGKDPFFASHQILYYINEHFLSRTDEQQLEHDTLLTTAAYRAG